MKKIKDIESRMMNYKRKSDSIYPNQSINTLVE